MHARQRWSRSLAFLKPRSLLPNRIRTLLPRWMHSSLETRAAGGRRRRGRWTLRVGSDQLSGPRSGSRQAERQHAPIGEASADSSRSRCKARLPLPCIVFQTLYLPLVYGLTMPRPKRVLCHLPYLGSGLDIPAKSARTRSALQQGDYKRL